MRESVAVGVTRHGIADRARADGGEPAWREGRRALSAVGRAQCRRAGLACAALAEA